MTRFEVCIIGAGPAGSAAAITAARSGLHVLLLDKDTFPRHKVCGEFISFESVGLLRALLDEEVDGLTIDSVRLFRNGKVKHGALPHSALSLSRFELDHRLLRAAQQAGAQALTGVRIKKVVRRPDGFAIASTDDTYHARHVINAAGRWSELRILDEIPGRRWIGLKQHFLEYRPARSTDLYFFPGGYCGVQSIDEDRINVCALVDAEKGRTLQSIFALSTDLQARARGWRPASDLVTTAPIIFGPPQPVADGILNAGDAAGFIDPFLGDGISIALQTGALAAECLRTTDPAKTYEREYRRRVAPALARAARLRSFSGSGIAWRAIGLPGMMNLAARWTRVRAA